MRLAKKYVLKCEDWFIQKPCTWSTRISLSDTMSLNTFLSRVTWLCAFMTSLDCLDVKKCYARRFGGHP